MKHRIESAFVRIGKLVQASEITNEDKQMAVGCLNELPALCTSFSQTYESRDVDKILRLERGMLARLAEPTNTSPKGRELAKRLCTRLKSFHEQLGLPPLNPKPCVVSPKHKLNQGSL